jgi:hypothetical protein
MNIFYDMNIITIIIKLRARSLYEARRTNLPWKVIIKADNPAFVYLGERNYN